MTTNIGPPAVDPNPNIHSVPSADSPGKVLPPQQLVGWGLELVEGFLQNVVIGLTGAFIPGAGTALEQLATYAAGVTGEAEAAVITVLQGVLGFLNGVTGGLAGEALQFAEYLLGVSNNANTALTGNAVATSQIGSVQSQINAPQTIPLLQSLLGEESSAPWKDCLSDFVITPSAPLGAIIPHQGAAQEKFTVALMGFKGTGCTGVYLDGGLYNATTGVVTRNHQSPNQALNLPFGSTSADYALLLYTIPANEGIVVNDGDLPCWLLTPVGGNLTVRGFTDPNIARPVRPKRMGFTLTGRMPATVAQATMDAAFSPDVPYVEFGRLIVQQPVNYYDDFERSTLGADWVGLRTTLAFEGVVPAVLGIQNGRLAFTSSSALAAWEGGWYRNRVTLVEGGMRTTVQVRNPNNVPAYLLTVGSPDWSSYVALGIRNVALDIWTGSGWPNLTPTGAQKLQTVNDGDYISFDWISGANRYDVYQHPGLEVPAGATPLFSWSDDGTHGVEHGDEFEYGGVMLSSTGFVTSAQFDDFRVEDVAAAVPVSISAGRPLPRHLPSHLSATPSNQLPLGVLDLTGFVPIPDGQLPRGKLELTGFAPVVKANYTDTFVRANSSTLGSGPPDTGWTEQGTVNLGIVSDIATPNYPSYWALAVYNTALNTNDQQVTITYYGATSSFDVPLIYLRSNGTDTVHAYCPNDGQWQIMTTTGSSWIASISSFTSRATSTSAVSMNSGDTIQFKAVGNVYTLYLNGTAVPGATWTDSSNAYNHVDSSHRQVAIGYYLQAVVLRGISNFNASDV